VAEQVLLSIVMTLKKFRNMLLVYEVNIYTDHKNLTFSTFQADQTIHWRLYVEGFGPTFFYVEGDTHTGADALSCLTIVECDKKVTEVMAEVYDFGTCPIAYSIIREAQVKEFPENQHNQWATKAFGSFIFYVPPTN
jgi:RNase H-like domain found in reverse transcriptase